MTIIDLNVPSNGGSDVNIPSADSTMEQGNDFLTVMSEDILQADTATEDSASEQDVRASSSSIDILFNTPKPSMPMFGFMAVVQNTGGQDAQIKDPTEGEKLLQAETPISIGGGNLTKEAKPDSNSALPPETMAKPQMNIRPDITVLQNQITSAPESELIAKNTLDNARISAETAPVNSTKINVSGPLVLAKNTGGLMQSENSVKQQVTEHNINDPKGPIVTQLNNQQEPAKLDQNAPTISEIKKLVAIEKKETLGTKLAMSSDQPVKEKTADKTDQLASRLSSDVISTANYEKPLKVQNKPVEHSMYSNLPKNTGTTVRHGKEPESEPRFHQPIAAAAEKPISAEQTLFISQTSEIPATEKAISETGSFASISEISAPIAAKTYADTSIHRPEMARHVAQQLADVARHMPDRPIELSLNPEELGRVRMTFTLTDGGINVAVMAERGETMDLLRRNIETLAQEFRELGHKEVNFSFSSSNQESSDQNNTNSNPVNKSEFEHAETDQIEPVRISLDQPNGLDIRL